MVSNSVIFVLFILASVIFAKWSEPIDLYTNEFAIELHTLYTDPLTGTNHIWWSIYDDSPSVYYMQTNSEGQVLFQTQIDIPNMQLFDAGKMVGLSNGKHLYIMLHGGRKCRTGILPQLCTEPLFSESKDGGRTWSPFALIQRPDMADKCNRDSYSLLVLPTGRIFIIYALNCDVKNEDSAGAPRRMSYVTRPPQGDTFSPERIIMNFDDMETSTGPLVDYTVDNGVYVIHLFWRRKYVSQQMIYMNSRNLGLTWSVPKELDDPGRTMLLHSMVSNPSLDSFMAGTFSSFGEPVIMFYTKDHGRTFTYTEIEPARGTKYMSEYSKDVAMAVCGTKSNPTLLTVGNTEELRLTYSLWDIKTMKATERDAPFGRYTGQDGVELSCFNVDNAVKVTSIVSARNNDMWRIRLSQEIINL